MTPLVSVITPVYNAEKTLLQSAQSVLSQDYSNLELLIIINGCTDGSEDIANDLSKNDSRVKIIKSKTGKVPARNAGFNAAMGEIIALNDADDFWLPGKLSLQVKQINRGYDVVGSAIECINDKGEITSDPIIRPLDHNEIVTIMLMGTNPIANSSAIFKKDLLNHIGTYDDCFPFCEDYHFWLKAVKFAKFKNLPDVLIQYFIHHSPGYDPKIPIALSSFYRSVYHYTGVI